MLNIHHAFRMFLLDHPRLRNLWFRSLEWLGNSITHVGWAINEYYHETTAFYVKLAMKDSKADRIDREYSDTKNGVEYFLTSHNHIHEIEIVDVVYRSVATVTVAARSEILYHWKQLTGEDIRDGV